MRELFQIAMTLDEKANQAHMTFHVEVPENVSRLVVNFNYSPIEESDRVALEHAVLREGYSVSILENDTILRNLLTLSIHDPYNFRGGRHYFNSNQLIEISEGEASFGFEAGDIPAGVWQFTIHNHACLSPNIKCDLKVQAVVEEPAFSREVPWAQLREPKKKVVKTLQVDRNAPWLKAELHTHTVHSDGNQTTEQLLTAAEQEGIHCLSITDHNTTSAYQDLQLNQHNLTMLQGVEYTTFYGHFLVHHAENIPLKNWNHLSSSSLQSFLQQLQNNEAFITIAHPFDMGNPFCTGCQWNYVLDHINHIDAIEVWNGPSPTLSLSNLDAYAKWTQLLQQGYEIQASCGGDWHNPMGQDEQCAYMFVQANDASAVSIIESLKYGRSYISMGPRIELTVNQRFSIGDHILSTDNRLQISLILSNMESSSRVCIIAGERLLYEKEVMDSEMVIDYTSDDFTENYVRIEIKNKVGDITAFTNPVYFQYV
ncbi:CehA/McbA family metallohydrolase [Viridibacillus arvi]|uniref:CehA/McbA family metallohydrolase n=1 Tax=Viridibacillus arvi TaxID=263475 RepID=UPI0036CCA092